MVAHWNYELAFDECRGNVYLGERRGSNCEATTSQPSPSQYAAFHCSYDIGPAYKVRAAAVHAIAIWLFTFQLSIDASTATKPSIQHHHHLQPRPRNGFGCRPTVEPALRVFRRLARSRANTPAKPSALPPRLLPHAAAPPKRLLAHLYHVQRPFGPRIWRHGHRRPGR